MKGTDGWKKTKTVLICSIFLIMNMSSNLFIEPVKSEETDLIYYVPDDGTLQDLINTSQTNDTIQINETINLSTFININKSIILQGIEDELIHINGSNEFGLNITVNNVTIRNLTIQNCSTAITLKNSSNSLDHITLEYIIIQNCSQHGIYINNTTQTNITHLEITNCNQTGIYLQNSSNTTISDNNINQSLNTGINITSNSNNNIINNNTFYNNSISINITSSENNTIVNNTFLNKTGSYYAYDDSTHNKWNTTTHGNYWGDYLGTDADNDDVGDSNYPIEGGSNIDGKPLGFFVPIVNFTFEPSSPTTSNTINFTDNSIDPNNENNQMLTYYWDFGDENTSEEQNPSHDYTENDQTYIVTLNVTNQYGQSNQTSQTLSINNSAPISLFTWSPQPGIVNETITFTSNCSDSDGADDSLSYNWSFGEGVYSEQQDSTHTYNQSGDYSVILNVTDNDGNTTSSSQTITVTYKPSVNFSISPSSPSTSDIITFTDTSTDTDGSISSWSWDFEDENTSTDENPTHSYDNDGTYTITLAVTDDDGATNQTNQTITISNSPPTANFTYTPHNATDLQTITFTNCSSDTDGTISNCTWAFGDGTTNYSMNTTSHQYSDNGTYTVTLNVTDDDGDTDEYSTTITISNVGPTADFTVEPANPKVGETIWFNDTSSDQDGSIDEWSWDFGDESSNTSKNATHTYSTLQSYDVTLTVTDNDGNSSSITKHLILKDTITKLVQSIEPVSYDLKEEANTLFQVKTINTTNISVTTYSECPSGIDDTIVDYENLQTYVDISLEEETLLDWINISLYYTDDDLNEDIDKSSLTLFYWNETNEEWIQIQNYILSTLDTNQYSGYLQANLSHLTLFTIAGKEFEEEDSISPTLPTIVNSSNNTIFTTATPIINVTYSDVVPTFSASLNGSDLLYETTDNKTFSILVHTQLIDGNYTVRLHLSNSTKQRIDTINFSIQLPSVSKKANTPVEIPLWFWYAGLSIIILFLIYYIEKKIHLINQLLTKEKTVSTAAIESDAKDQSSGIVKDTLFTLHQSINSFNTLLFGSHDPWDETKAELNQSLYNVDLFTEKPDAYVGIQQKLLNEGKNSKQIINLLKNQPESIDSIKEKTDMTKDELSHELSTLLKYGLIKVDTNDSIQLTKQAKRLINKK